MPALPVSSSSEMLSNVNRPPFGVRLERMMFQSVSLPEIRILNRIGLAGVRYRPMFMLTSAGLILFLGALTLIDIPPIPVNDKLLHFLGMFLIAMNVFFIVSPPSTSSSLKLPITLTLVSCAVFGSVGSEILQSLLTKGRHFSWGDILADLAALPPSIILSFYLLKRYNRAQERASVLAQYHPGEEGGELLNQPNIGVGAVDGFYFDADAEDEGGRDVWAIGDEYEGDDRTINPTTSKLGASE